MGFKQVRYQYVSGELIKCTFDSDLPMDEWSIDQYQAADKRDKSNNPKKSFKRVPKATSEGLNL